jgi:hypothetical protein
MAGLPGDVTLDPAWNAKCQAAALMMSAQGQLSHYPDSSWACYSEDGREAAGHSNLGLGNAGPEKIDSYIEDWGDSNYFVGHRRWILYPPQKVMGTGSVPATSVDGTDHSAANALWVIGGFGTRPASPEWVAWPPDGYVPYPVVYPRWSFSYPDADFSRATVAMFQSGSPVPLVTLALDKNDQGCADNTIVWEPAGLLLQPQAPDTTYSVTLTGVVVAGTTRTFNYEVTIIDPWPDVQTTSYVNGSTGNDDWDGMVPLWQGGRHGPKRTIQAGVDVTGPGHTVIVADGTYKGPGNRDIDFGGRLTSVRSANGPGNCIIDCEGAGRGFYFHEGESELAAVDGLTIRNGKADFGGAILCWESSPTISGCVLKGNTAEQVGGGVYGSDGIIRDCTVRGNSAGWGGGMAYCDGGISGCIIADNAATEQTGGGLYKCNGVVNNCTVTGNSAGWGGGMAYCDGTLRTCLVAANAAAQVGGGLYECNGAIENCTVSDNSAKGGGGLGLCGGTICNSIIWANTAPYGPQLYECSDPTYSCIQGIQAPGAGNISLNPLFASGGYRLGPTSPCIDAGDNSALNPPGLDLDGNLRIALGKVSLTVDMGAYEYNSGAFATVDIAFGNNMANLSWKSQPNDQYRVWSCVDLASGAWTEEANVPAQGAATSWTDGQALEALKFYRVEMR